MLYIMVLLYSLIVVSAGLAMCFNDSVHNLLALSVFSISLAVVFALFRAPDVAIAEVVVGSGIITGIFVITISNTVGAGESNDSS